MQYMLLTCVVDPVGIAWRRWLPLNTQLLDFMVKNCHLPLWTVVASKDFMSTLKSIAESKKVRPRVGITAEAGPVRRPRLQ